MLPLRRSLAPLSARGGSVAVFAPTSIAGLRVWADFSDITTLFQDSAGSTPVASDGDVIGKFTDLSTNNNHGTQAVTANKPIYKTNIKNGKSVSRYAGDALDTPDALNLSALSLFIVLKDTSNLNTFAHLTSPSTLYFGLSNTGTQKFEVFAGGAWRVGAATISNSNFYLVDYLIASGDLRTYVNGTIDMTSTAAVTLGGTYSLQIGGRSDDISDMTGDIAEVLLYDSVLSDANRQLVETYLNTKWAVY